MTKPSFHTEEQSSLVNSVLVGAFSVAIVVAAGFLTLATFVTA
ncbi:MAG TPA: hypothetical protein VFI93_05135 [Rhizomicrobium sp.]|jgi:hypothetical protein|nr:hypothetical protein [Rhizomicrobium sp.]